MHHDHNDGHDQKMWKLALLFVTTIRIYICQPNALALYE